MSESLRQSFADMCAREGAGLHRFAVAVCGDVTRADDLAQAALERMYVVWPRTHQIDHPGAYLRKVLVRVALREQRLSRWRREQSTSDPPERAHHDLETSAANRLDVTALLGSLTIKQRAVLILRFGEDRSISEVAALLGVSEGTVKRRTSDALHLLRRRAIDLELTGTRRNS